MWTRHCQKNIYTFEKKKQFGKIVCEKPGCDHK